MKNNYDPIANYYDVLSRMIYFRAQVNAQISQLRFVPAASKVLILGGGTGWILEELAAIRPSGLDITYVEISEKMLLLSQQRRTRENKVRFVHSPAEEFDSPDDYDVILTAFFFDNFTQEKVVTLFDRFDKKLKPKGLWLFTDFYYTEKSGKLWQAFLLKMMYFFFRQISSVEAHALINVEACFAGRGYTVLDTAYHYAGFIKAVVYRKS